MSKGLSIDDVVTKLNDYAAKCKENRQYESSRVALKRAIQLQPDRPLLYSNYGAVLWNMDDHDGAETAYKKAIELSENPDNFFVKQDQDQHSSPYANYGLLLAAMRKWDQSEYYFKLSIEKELKRVTPRWDLACMYLDKGDWAQGFSDYEIRKIYKGEKFYPKLPYPMWDGVTDLNGKTLYIQAEQGMGDRILFSRYLIWLKEKYPSCHIIYFTEPTNITLFWEYRFHIDLVPFGVPWPQADFGIYQMDLLRLHGSRPDNIIDDPGLFIKRVKPYAAFTQVAKPHLPSLKVGICWTGNPDQDLNQFRSIPLELMLQYAENPNVTLYSFQVGAGEKDIERLGAGDLVCNLAPELEEKGYVGTGCAMYDMDLIISCCTSVAHLAGVLKIPCMLLLCYSPYWIWMAETGRDSTIWYPKTMKLYRQPKPGDWQSIISQSKEELDQIVEQRMPILKENYAN